MALHHIRQVKTVREELLGLYGQNAGRAVFELLGRFCRELGENPEFYYTKGEGILWAFFPRAFFQTEDLIGEYAEAAGVASEKMPITLRGTTEENEIGEIRAKICGNQVEITKSNISGRDYDSLSDVCIRIQPKVRENLLFLWETAGGADFRKSCIVIPNRWKAFAEREGLTGGKTLSYFGYVELGEYMDTGEYLGALTVGQLSELWLAYLGEGISPVEFDWFFEELSKGAAFNIMAWELSLRLALDRLHITVKNENGGFSVMDGKGRPMKFDYRSLFSAEKVFLKLLFPAAYAG